MTIREFFRRLPEVLRRGRLERDLGDEVETHLALLTDDYLRQGLSPEAAREAARRTFGGVDQIKEAVRDRRGLPVVEHLGRDVRHALRVLRKAPAFTVVAVLTLALGIGVNTAIFSVIDAVMLRPLPFADPGRLVALFEARVGREDANASNSSGYVVGAADPNRMPVSPANFVDYQRGTRAAFSEMATFDTVSLTLTGVGDPDQLTAEEVTWNYFAVLGRAPALGRLPNATDGKPGARPVALLSDAFWRSRLGAAPGVIGTALMLNDQAVEVIGVMPAGFQAISELGRSPSACALWVMAIPDPDLLAHHGDHETNAVARLAPGVALATAQTALTAVSEALASAYPDSNKPVRAFVRPLQDDLIQSVRPSLIVLVVMVGLVLLIACVNVANLFIVRGAGQRRDVAIRYALGASRGRVRLEMLVQSLVLALLGGALGLLLGYWTKDTLIALAPSSVPRLGQLGLDGTVVGFAAGLALLTGVVFGLVPTFQLRATQPADALRTTSGLERGAAAWTMRWRNALMVAEVALSTILVVGAALAARSLASLNRVDVGFRVDHVLALNIVLPDKRYPTGAARYAFFSELESALSRIPGVSHVAFANRFPLRGGWGTGLEIEGVTLPGGYADVDFQAVSPDYFATLGLQLLRGRLLTAADSATSEPVVVVSERFSTTYLNGRDPVGLRVRRGSPAPWLTIVGVIADVRRGGQRAEVTAQGYLAAAQTTLYPVHLADVALVVGGEATGYVAPIQRAVWSVDPKQPITNVRTLDETLALGSKDQRFQTTLFSLFAALAVLLALVGIHGVVSYAVAQRTPEIGVRMALGADRRWVLGWLMREAAGLIGLGAALGLLGALGLSRFLANLLFAVKPTDPATYAVAVGALGTVALAACFLAARRATAIDPVRALRQE